MKEKQINIFIWIKSSISGDPVILYVATSSHSLLSTHRAPPHRTSYPRSPQLAAIWALLQPVLDLRHKRPTGNSNLAACYTSSCPYVTNNPENLDITFLGKMNGLQVFVFHGVLFFTLRQMFMQGWILERPLQPEPRIAATVHPSHEARLKKKKKLNRFWIRWIRSRWIRSRGYVLANCPRSCL